MFNMGSYTEKCERYAREVSEKCVRLHITIGGIVQGVGFRPFVYNLAQSHLLSGYVLNDTTGIDIEVEGKREDIQRFLEDIPVKSPPLAVIETINWQECPPFGYISFEIRSSHQQGDRFLPISPDICICNDCLRELLDPQDRRYRYPFINCTNCGPRFTIIKDIPYDRQQTTMSDFKMCQDCESEYHDPSNRRFHAQPNACWVCGPTVKLLDRRGNRIETDDAVSGAAQFLREGAIVAIKGIGGYHLACNATNCQVVTKLRERKNRVDKPFALMMLNIHQIKAFCKVSYEEERLLVSSRRPIVLLERKDKNALPEEIAPKNKYLGIMLPYTPLHYLLLRKMRIPLVMTSGNVSEEPIAYKDKDALDRLRGIADFFLVHNREIQMRVDDSVSRVIDKRAMLIRRSRGYAPQPVNLHVSAEKCVLALGGQLKNTFCLLKGNHGIISHHIGDLENLDALSALEEGIEYYKKIFYCQPHIIACDMHPNYVSTALAREYAKKNSLPLVSVQHHHAHIASVLAEKQVDRELIGVAFDGSGLGTDGNIWGDWTDFNTSGIPKKHPPRGSAPDGTYWRAECTVVSLPFKKRYLYVYEERIAMKGWPGRNMERLYPGKSYGFNLEVCDADNGEKLQGYILWSSDGTTSSWKHQNLWGTMHLAPVPYK